MPTQILAGPGALLDLAGPNLGHAPEKDMRQARAINEFTN